VDPAADADLQTDDVAAVARRLPGVSVRVAGDVCVATSAADRFEARIPLAGPAAVAVVRAGEAAPASRFALWRGVTADVNRDVDEIAAAFAARAAKVAAVLVAVARAAAARRSRAADDWTAFVARRDAASAAIYEAAASGDRVALRAAHARLEAWD